MAKVQRATKAAQVTAEQVQSASSLAELTDLWSRATDSGDATKLIDKFTARKKELGG
jgi:hypothetical protein